MIRIEPPAPGHESHPRYKTTDKRKSTEAQVGSN
jgi:hypothetical protein